MGVDPPRTRSRRKRILVASSPCADLRKLTPSHRNQSGMCWEMSVIDGRCPLARKAIRTGWRWPDRQRSTMRNRSLSPRRPLKASPPSKTLSMKAHRNTGAQSVRIAESTTTSAGRTSGTSTMKRWCTQSRLTSSKAFIMSALSVEASPLSAT